MRRTMNREALLRRRAEIEREFAAIQDDLARWEGEVKSVPAAPKTRSQKAWDRCCGKAGSSRSECSCRESLDGSRHAPGSRDGGKEVGAAHCTRLPRPSIGLRKIRSVWHITRSSTPSTSMPAPATDTTFQRFEKQNSDYALIVCRCPSESESRDDLCVTYRSPHINERTMIPLVMLYEAEEADEIKSHYITVTNKDALIRMDGNIEATCWLCMHTFAGSR